jgi:hypothetical protein
MKDYRVTAKNKDGKKYTFKLKGMCADDAWAKAQKLAQGNWHIKSVELA